MQHASRVADHSAANFESLAHHAPGAKRWKGEVSEIGGLLEANLGNRQRNVIVKPRANGVALAQPEGGSMTLQEQKRVNGPGAKNERVTVDIDRLVPASDTHASHATRTVGSERDDIGTVKNSAALRSTQLFKRHRRNVPRPSGENEDFREAARTDLGVRNRKIGDPWRLADADIQFDGFEMTIYVLLAGRIVVGVQAQHVA
ncbi:MAG: hypothetical protein WAK66_16805 [Methylocystis sp.]